MKTIITIWFCLLSYASAFSGETIAPVAIWVVDESGKPVSGASVTISKSRLKDMAKRHGDSEFGRLARASLGSAKTDRTGYVLRYCGGGWGPDGKKGNVSVLSGEVVVTAEGYKEVKLPFRRSFASRIEGKTEMILKVTVILKK